MNLISALRIIVVLAFTGGVSAEQLLIIQGASGDDAYTETFEATVSTWSKLASKAEMDVSHIHDFASKQSPRERIQNWLVENLTNRLDPLWIVFVGHGSFASDGAKLNLIGPDISAQELESWLHPMDRPLVFIHGGSASAPFLNALSGPNRILITATRSGTEQNYARFGAYFAEAMVGERSDIDLDGRVSLLEAFVTASANVETFYQEAGRLTSEHALIDDNGDAKGTPATSFKGLHPRTNNRTERMLTDGRNARKVSILKADGEFTLSTSQIKKRTALESKLESLYLEKENMDEGSYYRELESILLELSELYVFPESDT